MRRLARLIVVGAMIVSGLGATQLASADHQVPFDGSQHYYGEMVDYPLVFPVQGENWYSDWFWAYRANGLHHAQDIMADKMTPVVAAATGTVTYVNWSTNPGDLNPERCCNLVIRHDDGWQTWYIHLNNDTPGTDDGQAWGIAPGIVPGVRVNAGDLVGWVGDSGNAENTPPHLHLELYDPEGVLVNPFDALRASQGLSICTVRKVGNISALLGGSELLKNGSVGEQVRALQSFLDVFAHDPGPVDGIFGPLTETAVRSFQTERRLTIDGIVGSNTRGAIGTLKTLADKASVLDPDGRILSRGARGGDVVELQSLLKVTGHDPGIPDGYFGPKTEAAVRSFQQARGVAIDGLVGPGTRAALTQVLGLEALISCSG
ncbi:MAG TPA: peptidoglycan-binding protein [Acidimicrobiia bacterium]|nr:peptidoglycan-binding protein [Acidimicrobiia bacterium]